MGVSGRSPASRQRCQDRSIQCDKAGPDAAVAPPSKRLRANVIMVSLGVDEVRGMGTVSSCRIVTHRQLKLVLQGVLEMLSWSAKCHDTPVSF
jgi:hypothetical protein